MDLAFVNILENWTDIENISETPAPEINSFYFYATEQLIVLWILFLLIVFGNSAVLLALALNKSQKSRMNYFIMQLAIADLAVGLINVLTDIVWHLTIDWYAGNIACKIIKYLQVVVTFSSTYVLVALSIDRYDAIRHPMRFSGSWRRARILVGVAWFLSALFSLPIIIFYQEESIEGQLQCWIDFPEKWQWQLYVTIVSFILFVIPAITITACYAVIVCTIWRKSGHIIMHSNNYSKSKKSKCKNLLENKFVTEYDMDSRRASSRGLIPRAKVKTVKMTFVIVFVFILCWSPYIIFDLLQVYGKIPPSQTNTAIATFIQSLAPLNSAANPLIYCVFSTRICRTLKKLPPFSWFAKNVCVCCSSGNGTEYSSTMTSSVTTTGVQQRSSVTTTASSSIILKRHNIMKQPNDRHLKSCKTVTIV